MIGRLSGPKPVRDTNRIENLHQRYQQQAGWTTSIRAHLLTSLHLPNNARVLEIGCGTGVVLKEIRHLLPENDYFGIDLLHQPLAYTQEIDHKTGYAQSDANLLPFSSHTFDLIFCHFFLLWAKPTLAILQEASRVLKPASPFIAFAEPDYGGRIDYPAELGAAADLQEQALRAQGAHTRMGRELGHWFAGAGFADFTVGVLGGEWRMEDLAMDAEADREWQTLDEDLRSLPQAQAHDLTAWRDMDKAARANQERILFVPTFYGIGWKK
jgi:SAM-dependent methyltransferase